MEGASCKILSENKIIFKVNHNTNFVEFKYNIFVYVMNVNDAYIEFDDGRKYLLKKGQSVFVRKFRKFRFVLNSNNSNLLILIKQV